MSPSSDFNGDAAADSWLELRHTLAEQWVQRRAFTVPELNTLMETIYEHHLRVQSALDDIDLELAL